MNWFNFSVTAFFITGMVANIVFFLIQARKIYQCKSSKNLSFVTFLGFNVIQMSTILYGFLRDDKILAFGYIAIMFSSVTVTGMIYYYQKKN